MSPKTILRPAQCAPRLAQPIFIFLALTSILSACQSTRMNHQSHSSATSADSVTFVDYLHDFDPALDSFQLNAIVEIPAGTNAKWEVGDDGVMHQDTADGRPRFVNYLPYPANYGMVPRSVMSAEVGGDGDPLDIIVLDTAIARGSLIRVRLIGALKLLDRGEVDDKLVAVTLNGKLGDVTTISDLNGRYKGITTILETWFVNYKGPGKMQSGGFVEADSALSITRTAIEAFK